MVTLHRARRGQEGGCVCLPCVFRDEWDEESERDEEETKKKKEKKEKWESCRIIEKNELVALVS